MPERGVAIAIVGAGPVGMCLALALAHRGLRPVVVDARAPGAWANDPRVVAVSEGSRQILASLAAWPDKAATPIAEVHVSQAGGFGRTLMRADEHDLAALGHVLRFGDLCHRLDAAVRAAGIEIRHDWPVTGTREVGDQIEIAGPGESRAADLVVHAEGSGGDSTEVIDYGQDALICEADPGRPHRGRAWERFTPDGPLALLPCGSRFAVVFVCGRAAAETIAAEDAASFCARLEARMAGRMRFLGATPRVRIPLALRVRGRSACGRELWIGNAAQTLHPVSGQGLNLGLRDARELAGGLAALTDPADVPARVAALARRRWPDRAGGIAFTDGIVRIFGNDLPPLRLARGLGLGLLDVLPGARRWLATRMMFGLRGPG